MLVFSQSPSAEHSCCPPSPFSFLPSSRSFHYQSSIMDFSDRGAKTGTALLCFGVCVSCVLIFLHCVSGGGGLASESLANVARRERLKQLVLENVDLSSGKNTHTLFLFIRAVYPCCHVQILTSSRIIWANMNANCA